MDKGICFLFGAGAETDGKKADFKNFDMPTGQKFMHSSYLNKELNENMTNALKEIFTGNYFTNEKDNAHYKYTAHKFAVNTTYKSILKKWTMHVCQTREFYDKYKDEIDAILNNDELKELLSSLRDEDAAKPSKDTKKSNGSEEDQTKTERSARGKIIHTTFANLYGSLSEDGKIEIPERPVAETLFIGDAEANKTILEQSVLSCLIEDSRFKNSLPTGISHILDSHFHTIIDPARHGQIHFSRVFNYYWSIFFAICQQVCRLNVEDSTNCEIDHNSFVLDLKNNIEEMYSNEFMEGWAKKDKTSYYHFIKEVFGGRVSGVITSNYYKFAEHIIKPRKTAYLNGELRYFEIPETLEVIDVTKESLPKDKLYFPFIFGQSYLKPIVSRHQIEAFHKFEQILNDSQLLVILGYNINEDDNHINAYLREFALSHPIVIVFKPGDKDKDEVDSVNNKKIEVKNKLRLIDDDNIYPLAANYKQHPPKQVISRLDEFVNSIFD